MNFFIRRILFIVLLAGSIFSVTAQFSENNFIRYTTKEGLSEDYITSVVQDSIGYMWIGTSDGLNRFDGTTFTSYYHGFPEKFLVSSNIANLKLMNKHQIGVLGSHGFQIIDPKSLTVRNYFIPDSTAFVTKRNATWDVVELPGNKYALTTASGFYVFNADCSLDFRYDHYHPEDLGHKRILYGRTIMTLPDNKLLLYVDARELAFYDVKTKKYTHIGENDPAWKTFYHPRTATSIHWITKAQISDSEFIFLSPNDSLIYFNYRTKKKISSPLPFHWRDEFTWQTEVLEVGRDTFALTGGYSGMFMLYLNRQTGKMSLDTHMLFSETRINSIFKDKDSRFWIGTSDGLLKQVIAQPFISRFKWPVTGKHFYGYTDCMRVDDVIYFTRFAQQGGLLEVDAKTMEVLREIQFYNGELEWNFVHSLIMYHPDTLWLGTNGGPIWYSVSSGRYGKLERLQGPNKVMLEMNVFSPADKNGNAWLLQYGGGNALHYNVKDRTYQLFNEHTNPPLPFNQVKHVVYDSYGDAWIAGHSLARWSNKKGQFDTLLNSYGGPNQYNENIVAIVADEKGSLWFHNTENGLLQYDIMHKKFHHIGMKDGLTSNTILCLSPVINDYMFASTPHHLLRIDTKTKGLEIFANEIDLPTAWELNNRMYWDERQKFMYAFYVDEVARFPVDRPQQNYHTSEIIIQEVLINNESKISFPGNRSVLNSSDNSLSIYYTIIDFEGSNDYRFAYMLDGSEQWINLGKQRVIHLPKLTAGRHTLKIRATGISGEQKITEFEAEVKGPFWSNPLVVSFTFILLASIVYALYRSRINRIKEKANVDKLLSQTEMKALHAQMNPHFIFNSLNSIREMVLNNEIKEASRYLSNFAHLIRMTLDQSRQSYISLRHTMEYLNRYVEMEKVRNPDFEFAMSVDTSLDTDDTIMPPMLIQPFVENAIWHGMNGEEKTIKIKVDFRKCDDRLVCVIDDDGVGIDHSLALKKRSSPHHDSVGISNIEKRIDLLNKKYNFQSHVTIMDKKRINGNNESGTLVSISLPLDISEQ